MASKGTQLSTNQLVLMRQPNLALLQWAMGRVLGSSRRHCSHRNYQNCQGFLREVTETINITNLNLVDALSNI